MDARDSTRGLIRVVLVLISTALIAIVGVGLFRVARDDRDSVTLSIVGTSDLHGALRANGDLGGLSVFGGYMANLRVAREADGGAVLLLDSGDLLQGTLESNLGEGAAVVAAYNLLGYTAAAIGNHDFDFGPVGTPATPQQPDDDPRGSLKARAAEAEFPFLAANVIDTGTNNPVVFPNAQPSVMVSAAGLAIGIIGVTTERTLSGTIAANTVGLRIAPLAETIVTEATRLRAAGASVVLVAAHAGDGRCSDVSNPSDSSSCNASAEIVRVAQALPVGLVDAIVAGHSHAAMAHEVNGVPIIEAYSNGRAFGRIDLIVERAAKRVIERRIFPPRDICASVLIGTVRCGGNPANGVREPAEYEGARVTAVAAVEAAVAPAIERAAALKATPLGMTLATPLRRRGDPESPLGNLVTDALLAAVSGADVAINNTVGGLRADLPAGPLTYGAVFDVMPFDNRLVAIEMTAAQLRSALAARVRTPAALAGLAGLRARVVCRGPEIELALLRPDGAAVSDDERLLVATSDFLALGGDRILEPIMPPDGFPIARDAGLVRDAIVEALRNRGDQLSEDALVDRENPRWVLPGAQPVTCEV